tara:strand:- start:549 stop:968 length:420 start_codon:yes stop_codon:yes gene_type:complete
VDFLFGFYLLNQVLEHATNHTQTSWHSLDRKMKIELENILKLAPSEVLFSEIIEFDKLDERISAVGVLFANTIGVNENSIKFCPDNEPPLIEEIISWIWTFRPDLGIEILNQELSDDLMKLISSYENNEMDKFWVYINE